MQNTRCGEDEGEPYRDRKQRLLTIFYVVICALFGLIVTSSALLVAHRSLRTTSYDRFENARFNQPKLEWDPAPSADQCNMTWIDDGQAEALLAYLFLAHPDEDSLPGNLGLVRELWNPFDLFVIHVDLKVPQEQDVAWRANFAGCPNILFTRERYDVRWGKWEIVAAELAAMKVALASPIRWQYSIVLDGLCWVLTNASERRRRLLALPAEFSAITDVRPIDKNGELCFQEKQIADKPNEGSEPGKCFRTPARCKNKACQTQTLTPYGYGVVGGQQWVTLSRNVTHWAAYSDLGLQWQRFFRKTEVPDEYYFSSVLFSSPYAGSSISPSLVLYSDWNTEHCETKTAWPCEFGMSDLPRLRDNGALFVRKVLPNSPLRQALGNGAA